MEARGTPALECAAAWRQTNGISILGVRATRKSIKDSQAVVPRRSLPSMRLKIYRQRMHADENIWSLATMQGAGDLAAAKEKLGLIVLAAPFKEFVHNSAFLVISNQGKLLGIYDDDDIQGALTLAAKSSEYTAGHKLQ